MPVEPLASGDLTALAALIDAWAAAELETNPIVAAVDVDPELRRWYVRLRGEEKATMTVWLTLRERTLQYESYFMPAPEEHVDEVYGLLLRANMRLFGLRFAVGEEDAVYLVGQVPASTVDETALDGIVGATYAYTEQYFKAAMRMGLGSRFRG